MFVGWGCGIKLLWLVKHTGLLWFWGLENLCLCFCLLLCLAVSLWGCPGMGGRALSYCGVQNHLFIVVLGPPTGMPFVGLFFAFCKESVIESHTFFVSVSFCVWSWLCLWDPLPRSCKTESSCEGSLSGEGEKRPEGFWGEGEGSLSEEGEKRPEGLWGERL